jgi:hypothetical protein
MALDSEVYVDESHQQLLSASAWFQQTTPGWKVLLMSDALPVHVSASVSH